MTEIKQNRFDKISMRIILIISLTLLLVYFSLFPYFVKKISSYGAFIIFPLLGLSVLGKKIALLFGSIFLTLNIIVHMIFIDYLQLSSPNLIFPNFIVLAILFIFGSYTDMYMEKVELLENIKQQNSEIKELRHLIPICSYCKKVKDSSGYWTEVETYIKKLHLDSEFTHGVCKDCYDNLMSKNQEMI